jgi:hypothetical protein
MVAEGSGADFRALPIRLSTSPTVLRHLYIKPHADADGLPKGPAVFVVGLPVLLHEAALMRLFSEFGEVERAAIHGRRTSAAILYADVAGRDRALRAAFEGRVINVDATPLEGPRGLKAWVEAHKAEKPGNRELLRQLDEWTEAFEAAEEERKKAAAQSMEEDGWTVVQRHKVLRFRITCVVCSPLYYG